MKLNITIDTVSHFLSICFFDAHNESLLIYCTLQNTTLHYNVHYTTLHYIMMCTVLYFTKLWYILRYTKLWYTLQYITLHYDIQRCTLNSHAQKCTVTKLDGSPNGSTPSKGLIHRAAKYTSLLTPYFT